MKRLTSIVLFIALAGFSWTQQPTSGIYNTTQPAPANGAQTTIQQDQSANLLWFPGVQFVTGTAWNSGTSANTLQYPTGTATEGAPIGSQGVIVQLDQTSTISGGAVTFQGTYDNTNWVTVPVAQVLNPNTFAQLTNPYTLVASTNQPFLIVVGGYMNVRAKLTTAITGSATVTPYWTSVSLEKSIIAPIPAGTNVIGGVNNAIAQTDPANGSASAQGTNGEPNMGTDNNLWVAVQPSLRPASYVASKSFAGSSTTDNAVLPGNATNTVLVTRIIVSCVQTTAVNLTVNIIKRSAADSGGTSTAMTVVPDDSTFTGGSSAPLSYTGTGPSVGAAVGNVDTYQLGCLAPATASPNDIYILDRRLKPIVLRGTAQQLAVNMGSAAITGGNLTVTFEWEEVKTITP
jgi:hypothetical protein